MTDSASELVVYAARLIRQVRRAVGVSAAHRVLSLLDETGPVSISQLAAADASSQPTMSAQVQALMQAGLVTKEPSPDDARATVVTMTEAGRRRLAENREHILRVVEEHISGPTADEIAAAVSVLRAITEKGFQ